MTARSQGDALGSVLAQRYRLDALLGRGAMGTVYRGLDIKTGREVAVKVMHASLAGDPAIVERFTREAEAASQLDHRNCVQVLAAGTTSAGTRFLVMPLLDGIELRREIAGGMALHRVIEIILQVLAGLEHAHTRGFVHRDVKPENVLLVRDEHGDEVAKLVDFGLVKAITAAPNGRVLTAFGKVFGTPWYMAPEQAAGEHIDARADLYAVGMMMFEMLTGAPPFDGDSLNAVLHKHMFAELPALPSWLPAPIAAVVKGLAAKRREDRPADAAAAATALRRALVGASSQLSSIPRPSIPDVALELERPTSMLRQSQRQGRMFGIFGAIAAACLLAVGLPRLLGGDALAATGADDASASAAIIAPITTAPAPQSVAKAPPSPVTSAPAVAPSVPAPASTMLAAATPSAATVPLSAPDHAARSTGAHPSTSARTKPPSKPAPVATATHELPAPPRKLVASRPPRTDADKLPGVGPGGQLRNEGGKLHLRPRDR
jgi:serine/threonine protein kinase